MSDEKRHPSAEFPFDEQTSAAHRSAAAGPNDDSETLVGCPACERCLLCSGRHMVPAQVRVEYENQHGRPMKIPLEAIGDDE